MPDRPEQTEYSPKLPDTEFLKKQNHTHQTGGTKSDANESNDGDQEASNTKQLPAEAEASIRGEELRPKDDSLDKFSAR